MPAYDACIRCVCRHDFACFHWLFSFLIEEVSSPRCLASVSMGRYPVCPFGGISLFNSDIWHGHSFVFSSFGPSILKPSPLPFHLRKEEAVLLLIQVCFSEHVQNWVLGCFLFICFGNVIMSRGWFFYGMAACKYHASYVYPGLKTLFSLSFTASFFSLSSILYD